MVLCDTEVPSGEKGVEEEVSHVKLNYGNRLSDNVE